MTIIEKINAEQNKRNIFTNVSLDDLKAICLSIDAMNYHGWKREKATEIVINKYINGQYWRNDDLVYNYLMHK